MNKIYYDAFLVSVILSLFLHLASSAIYSFSTSANPFLSFNFEFVVSKDEKKIKLSRIHPPEASKTLSANKIMFANEDSVFFFTKPVMNELYPIPKPAEESPAPEPAPVPIPKKETLLVKNDLKDTPKKVEKKKPETKKEASKREPIPQEKSKKDTPPATHPPAKPSAEPATEPANQESKEKENKTTTPPDASTQTKSVDQQLDDILNQIGNENAERNTEEKTALTAEQSTPQKSVTRMISNMGQTIKVDITSTRLEIIKMGYDLLHGDFNVDGKPNLNMAINIDLSLADTDPDKICTISKGSNFEKADDYIKKMAQYMIKSLTPASMKQLRTVISKIPTQLHIDEANVHMDFQVQGYSAFSAGALFQLVQTSIEAVKKNPRLSSDTRLVVDHLKVTFDPMNYSFHIVVDIPRELLDRELIHQFGKVGLANALNLGVDASKNTADAIPTPIKPEGAPADPTPVKSPTNKVDASK